jgi:hypothetical protein
MPGRTTTTNGEGASGPPTPAAFSANRIVLLVLVAFTIALAVHGLIHALGAGDSPLRLFVTPLIGAGVIFAGLRGYPLSGRIRLGVMVGVGLLLIAGMV